MDKVKIYRSVEDIDKDAWQSLLKKSPYANFFQSPACYEFYGSLSFLKPFVFGVSENNELKGLIVGYLIAEGGKVKQFFSRRAIVPGGALLAKDISDNSLKELLNILTDKLSRKSIYIELRNFFDYSQYKKTFEEAGFAYNAHLNYQIAAKPLEEAFAQLSENRQRQIKRAEKEGVTYQTATSQKDVDDFYYILSHLYKKRIKRPLFPVEFFYKLIELDESALLVVKKEEQIIGGIACVGLTGGNLYEWFVCGDENVDGKLYPSVMATWAGIEHAMENQHSMFDFMGAGKPDKAYGVREFKSRFGGEEVEFGRFLFINRKFLYNLGVKYFK